MVKVMVILVKVIVGMNFVFLVMSVPVKVNASGRNCIGQDDGGHGCGCDCGYKSACIMKYFTSGEVEVKLSTMGETGDFCEFYFI